MRGDDEAPGPAAAEAAAEAAPVLPPERPAGAPLLQPHTSLHLVVPTTPLISLTSRIVYQSLKVSEACTEVSDAGAAASGAQLQRGHPARVGSGGADPLHQPLKAQLPGEDALTTRCSWAGLQLLD